MSRQKGRSPAVVSLQSRMAKAERWLDALKVRANAYEQEASDLRERVAALEALEEARAKERA